MSLQQNKHKLSQSSTFYHTEDIFWLFELINKASSDSKQVLSVFRPCVGLASALSLWLRRVWNTGLGWTCVCAASYSFTGGLCNMCSLCCSELTAALRYKLSFLFFSQYENIIFSLRLTRYCSFHKSNCESFKMFRLLLRVGTFLKSRRNVLKWQRCNRNLVNILS